MTSSNKQPPFDSTSAAGAMLKRQARETVFVGCILAGFGTSAAHAQPTHEVLRSARLAEQTTAGASLPSIDVAGASIGELRRLSGLTWDQLARLFNVSRRSLHFWASGKPMAPSNEEHLQRLLRVVRAVDRGSASVNRTALLGACEGGALPFDLLAAGEYDRVLALLGRGESQPARPPKPSQESKAERMPRPPEELIGALQDRVHREEGPGRPVKSMRIRSDR